MLLTVHQGLSSSVVTAVAVLAQLFSECVAMSVGPYLALTVYLLELTQPVECGWFCWWLRVQICARMLEALALGQRTAVYTCCNKCDRIDKVRLQDVDAVTVKSVTAWAGRMLSCKQIVEHCSSSDCQSQVRYLQVLCVQSRTLRSGPGCL